jgi:hypothetical protein
MERDTRSPYKKACDERMREKGIRVPQSSSKSESFKPADKMWLPPLKMPDERRK